MSPDEQTLLREREWPWPREPEWLQKAHDRAATLAEARVSRIPEATIDNDELRRAVIALQLAPSAAARAAAAASGDPTAWIREEQAWIADRLASGTNPRIPRTQRARRATRPESPKARRSDAFKAPSGDPDAGDAQAEIAVPPAPDKRPR